jgi:hypothetical protein
MKSKKTIRGFTLIEFDDLYEQKCSLQKSSIATTDAIWFGVDNTGERLGDKDVNNRMHLNRKQVKTLLPYLIKFVETGEL